MPKFSIIIPVYNRPDEVAELLESLTHLSCPDIEILVIEDGSSVPCDEVVKRFEGKLPVRYFSKPNSGPGQTRNYGAERAKGEYLLIWDSDILIPQGYFETIETFLQTNPVDAFGGTDRAHESFTGEDIDFSYRIVEAGYKTALIPDAYVYHKRRTDFRKFFRQVHNSGIARINLSILHPGTLKLVHTLPALFTLAVIPFLPLMPLYALMVFADAAIQNKSFRIGALAVVAAFTQLIGYGTGFIGAAFRRYILKKENKDAFMANFYK